MPRPSRERSDAKREEDRALMAAQLRDGATQREVAALLGVSRQTIGKDFKALKEQWRARAARDVNGLIEESLARLELAQRECLAAWLESREIEAMREYGRCEDRRMRLMGIEGQYQVEPAAEDIPKPEDVKTAEDADRLYKRAVGGYKPFSIVQGGRGRGR